LYIDQNLLAVLNIGKIPTAAANQAVRVSKSEKACVNQAVREQEKSQISKSEKACVNQAVRE